MAAVHGIYQATPPSLTDGRNSQLQLDSSGNLKATTTGGVASGATNAGNPVKVGAVFNNALPTFADGQIGDVQMSSHGAIYAEIKSGFNSVDASTSLSDAQSNSSVGLHVFNFPRAFNGTSWDRKRNNEEATLLASAARTTTQTSADIVNYDGLGALAVVLDVTSAGTGSITISIDGKDSTSGKYYNLLTGAAVTTNSTNRYRVGPTLAAVANSIAQDYLPRVFRIVVTANNANSMTYSVGYCLIRG